MQAGAAKSGQNQAQAQFQQQRGDLAPYRDAAVPALNAQSDLLGLNGQPAADAAMANFQQSPGYQWQLTQGLRGVDAGAAASGMLRSGATLKAEDTYAQGLANQDFTNYYNRLYDLSKLGENAAAGNASTATAAGNSAASAANTQASIYGNAAGGIANTTNSLFSNKDFTSWLSGSGGSGGNTPNAPNLIT
jgi:hypothetical protein